MRILLITTENLYSGIITEPLFHLREHEVIGVIKTNGIFAKLSLFETLRRITMRYSVSFFAFKILETLCYRLLIFLSGTPCLATWVSRNNIPMMAVSDINAASVIEHIRALRPELIISVSANQRFEMRLIELASRGCLNVHSSLLPKYRGVAPYFWVLAKGETQTGVSVHRVDKDLDTGRILAQARVSISPEDTMHTLFLKCSVAGRGILLDALSRLSAGDPVELAQEGTGTYFSWPTPPACAEFRSRGRKFWRIGEFVKSVCQRDAANAEPALE